MTLLVVSVFLISFGASCGVAFLVAHLTRRNALEDVAKMIESGDFEERTIGCARCPVHEGDVVRAIRALKR